MRPGLKLLIQGFSRNQKKTLNSFKLETIVFVSHMLEIKLKPGNRFPEFKSELNGHLLHNFPVSGSHKARCLMSLAS